MEECIRVKQSLIRLFQDPKRSKFCRMISSSTGALIKNVVGEHHVCSMLTARGAEQPCSMVRVPWASFLLQPNFLSGIQSSI